MSEYFVLSDEDIDWAKTVLGTEYSPEEALELKTAYEEYLEALEEETAPLQELDYLRDTQFQK